MRRLPSAAPPLWPAMARVLFGLVLLADAVLEWQPGTYQVFSGLLLTNAASSPPPLHAVIALAASVIANQPVAANAALASVETALGLLITVGLATDLALALSLPMLLGVWLFGEGLGLAFTRGATDLGAGAAYLLCLVLLLATRSGSRMSLDRLIQRGRIRPALVGAAAALGALLLALAAWGSARAIAAEPGQAGPPAVGGASLVFDRRLDSDLLFGGCGQLVCSPETWVWNGRNWAEHSGASPGALGYAAAAYDASRGQVVLFGGAAAQGVSPPRASTWRWEAGWARLRPATAPRRRRLASAAYDPTAHQLLLFGGETASGHPIAGTWVWTRAGWVRLHPAHQPPARSAAALAWDPRNHWLLLFGGSDGSGRLRDTWAWTGHDWTRVRPQHSPPALAYEAMATDPLTGTVLLYAGAGADRSTWVWTGSDWRPLSTAKTPPAYSFVALAAAPKGRGVLLFGGATSSGQGFTDETWLFNGSWQQLTG
ncbi:MAG: hypothetical protein ACREN4_01740 [Candidatus Dormibacteria bacterium]